MRGTLTRFLAKVGFANFEAAVAASAGPRYRSEDRRFHLLGPQRDLESAHFIRSHLFLLIVPQL